MTRSGEFNFKAIGFVQSPFKDRFGVPRQPGLASNARGIVKLSADPDLRTALRSLDSFTHIWIVFVFHAHGGAKWKPSIRPPRLGGAVKVGVLASRSPHRPNPIGISVCELAGIDLDAPGGPEIRVNGIDLIDGTPVLDIKPYIPYADSVPSAGAGWASAPIERRAVTFACTVPDDARALIIDVLELDPRPAFQKRQVTEVGSQFGIEIAGYEVKYEIAEGGFLVTSVTTSESSLT